MTGISEILRTTAHRPWPLPTGPWIMFQSWQTLLFGHWRVSRSVLRLLVPAQLDIDEFDGSPWVGLTPFRIVGLRPRFMPALPWVSNFPELNLRTYVTFGGTRGIYFFTLEAASLPAVLAARALYHLPYRHADMDVHRTDGWIAYRSRRRKGHAAFAARYRPVGEPFRAVGGTVEHFLTERYALYTVDDEGRVLRGDVHHAPWTLQPAEAEIELNTIAGAHGIQRPREAPLLHYSERLDTLLWRLKRVG